MPWSFTAVPGEQGPRRSGSVIVACSLGLQRLEIDGNNAAAAAAAAPAFFFRFFFAGSWPPERPFDPPPFAPRAGPRLRPASQPHRLISHLHTMYFRGF